MTARPGQGAFSPSGRSGCSAIGPMDNNPNRVAWGFFCRGLLASPWIITSPRVSLFLSAEDSAVTEERAEGEKHVERRGDERCSSRGRRGSAGRRRMNGNVTERGDVAELPGAKGDGVG